MVFWYKQVFGVRNYLEDATSNKKKSIRRMAVTFFLSGEVLYWRTPNLSLLRCVDAAKLIEEIHAGVCGTYMNGLNFARKIIRFSYFWMTMEHIFVNLCINVISVKWMGI